VRNRMVRAASGLSWRRSSMLGLAAVVAAGLSLAPAGDAAARQLPAADAGAVYLVQTAGAPLGS
jgi:hypothetical protein